MIYIERHIAGSLNLGNVCLIRIYMVFSEYKRRLISTHIYLSNVLLTKIWDFKIRSTRNLLYAQVVILPIFVIVILQKTQLDLFRNKFVHINVITLKSNFKVFLDRVWIKYYSMKCEQKLANGFE